LWPIGYINISTLRRKGDEGVKDFGGYETRV